MPRFPVHCNVHSVQTCNRTHDTDIQVFGLKVLTLLDMKLYVVCKIFIANGVIDRADSSVHLSESVFEAFTSVNQVGEYTASNDSDLFCTESDYSDWFRDFRIFVQQCQRHFECRNDTECSVVFSAVIDSVHV